jgi:hypothetical protein
VRCAPPETFRARTYEGWSHFQQDRVPAEAIIKGSPYGDRVTWLDPGEDITLPV